MPGECVLSLSKGAAKQTPLHMQVNPQRKMCWGSQSILGKGHSHCWWLRGASLTNSIILIRMNGPWKPLLLQCMYLLCHRTAGQGRVMSETPWDIVWIHTYSQGNLAAFGSSCCGTAVIGSLFGKQYIYHLFELQRDLNFTAWYICVSERFWGNKRTHDLIFKLTFSLCLNPTSNGSQCLGFSPRFIAELGRWLCFLTGKPELLCVCSKGCVVRIASITGSCQSGGGKLRIWAAKLSCSSGRKKGVHTVALN